VLSTWSKVFGDDLTLSTLYYSTIQTSIDYSKLICLQTDKAVWKTIKEKPRLAEKE